MANGVVGIPSLPQRAFRSSAYGELHRTQLRAVSSRRVSVASSVGPDVTKALSEAADITALVAVLDATDSLTPRPALALPETADGLALSPAALQSSFACRVWNSYLELLEEKPVLVKSLTSLFGFMIGDICAQLIMGADYDIYRTLRMTLFGILMDGPIGHFWYLFLDKNVMPENSRAPKAIIAKTVLDQLIWAPFFSCVFFTFNQTLQNTLIPTLTANYALWPLAHVINFKFIPSNQRILYINFVQILWTSYLSNLAARNGQLVSHVQQHVAHPVAGQLMRGMQHQLLHHVHHYTDFFHGYAHNFIA